MTLAGLHGTVLVGLNLLAVAFATACSARCQSPFWRRFWPVMMAVVMLSGVLTAVMGGWQLLQQNIAPRWFFGFFLALLLVSAAGSVVVIYAGLRAGSVPWRRWPLAVMLALAMALSILVLEQMQSRSMLELAQVQSEAASHLLVGVPGHVPPSTNARRHYDHAIQLLGDDKTLPEWFHEGNAPDAEPDLSARYAFLESKAQVLALVARATAMPFFRPPLKGINFYEWPLPDLKGFLRLARLLVLSARADLHTADVSAALARMDQMHRMAGHIAQGPFLISHVLADKIDTMRLRNLEYLMAKADIPAETLKAALELPEESSLERFKRTLCLEAQGQLHGFTLLATTTDIHATGGVATTMMGEPNAVTRMWRAYFLPADLRAARDIVARQMCLPADSFAHLKANLDVIEKARQDGEMGILSGIAVPNFASVLTPAMRHDALEKMGALALAATSFRESEGRWPANAASLVPVFITAVPEDPFDGTPLKLKAIDAGIELYSNGPTADDGRPAPIRFLLGRAAHAHYGIQPNH